MLLQILCSRALKQVLEKQSPVSDCRKKLRAPRNTALSKIINAVAMTTLMSTKNAHNNVSSFSDKAMVIFC